MPPSNIVTAADYADAMMVARRAKKILFLILLLMLLAQIGLFFTARYTRWIIPDAAAAEPSLADRTAPAVSGGPGGPGGPATAPSTQPQLVSQPGPAAPQGLDPARQRLLREALQYITAGIDFLGFICVIVLVMDLLLIVNIMLVGRLVGVAQVTSAWVWCILLALLLFPWQSFLQTPDFTGDFKIPGVLYTWNELIHPVTGAKFQAGENFEMKAAVLRWVRFVVFPVLSVILLLVIQARSSRGLRAALGESDLDSIGEIQTP